MLKDIASIYRASKKKRDINLWTEWVCRPPAAVVVYGLRNTRITPNQVTFLSLVVCAGAGAVFALCPGHLWLVVAAVVFELSFVLDCADGQLARIRGVASPLGHLLDFLMDEIKAMLVYGCVAVRLWRDTGDERLLVVGVGGMFCLASGIALTSFLRRPEYSGEQPTPDGQPAVVRKRSGPIGLALTTAEHAARIVVHYPSYIWLACAFNRVDIYFWAYTAVNVLYLGRCFLVVLLRLGRFAPPAPLAAPAGAAAGGPSLPPAPHERYGPHVSPGPDGPETPDTLELSAPPALPASAPPAAPPRKEEP